MAECRKRKETEAAGFLHGGDLEGAAEKSGFAPSDLLDFSAIEFGEMPPIDHANFQPYTPNPSH